MFVMTEHIECCCRIRKAGYPIRHTFKEFIDRYHVLTKSVPHSYDYEGLKEATMTVARRFLGSSGTEWQMGRTKIFLKVI